MEDVLSQIRDNYFAGYYAKSLQLAHKYNSNLSDLEKAELFSFQLRAKMALHRDKGSTPGPSHTDTSTIATINFIDFWNADTPETEKLHLNELRERSRTEDPIACYLASAALCKEGKHSDMYEALRLSTQGPVEMELLRTMQMVLIDRADLAEQLTKSLLSTNDDAVTSKIASAATSLMTSNFQEAYLTYNDIQVQCCEGDEQEGASSILLLNGKAVANMERQHWDEALEDLQKAHQQDPDDVDTLCNLVACCQWLRQEDDYKKYLTRLSELSPYHPTIIELGKVQQAFQKFRAVHTA